MLDVTKSLPEDPDELRQFTALLLAEVKLSSDIRNWPGGDMKNWPTLMLIRLWFRAPQRAFAKARCGAFREGGSCRLGW